MWFVKVEFNGSRDGERKLRLCKTTDDVALYMYLFLCWWEGGGKDSCHPCFLIFV